MRIPSDFKWLTAVRPNVTVNKRSIYTNLQQEQRENNFKPEKEKQQVQIPPSKAKNLKITFLCFGIAPPPVSFTTFSCKMSPSLLTMDGALLYITTLQKCGEDLPIHTIISTVSPRSWDDVSGTWAMLWSWRKIFVFQIVFALKIDQITPRAI